MSLSTASLVLAGKGRERRISEEVHVRVRIAAQELDYVPNLLVRSLQSGTTGVLSFYNGFRNRSLDDLYMDRLSTAIERAAGTCGYDVLVHSNFQRSAQETYQMLNGGRSDGLLLFAPTPDDPLLPLLRDSRMPCVLLNASDEAGLLSSVQDDMAHGMWLIAQRLLQSGHRKIAMLYETGPANQDAEARVKLLDSFLQQHGIEIPPHCIQQTNDSSDAHLESILHRLITHPEPPTAIFCWNDRLGYRVMDACQEAGVEIPQELSLIGYDGIHWPSHSRHVLTSVQVDLNLLATTAVQMLCTLLAMEGRQMLQKAIRASLLQGGTVAPPSR